MKFEIRNLALLVSNKISKINKESESQMVREIMSSSGKVNLSEEEMKELSTAQAELDEVYQDKARGAFVRCRRKWLEQGQKCTKYFFNLEKQNFELSSLSKLKINDLISDDEKQISQFVTDFYKRLYGADQLDEVDMMKLDMAEFLKGIEPDTKKIDDNFKSICDQKISINRYTKLH